MSRPDRRAEDHAEIRLAEMQHRLANCFLLIVRLVRLRLEAAEGVEARQHLMSVLDEITSLGMLQQLLSGPKKASLPLFLRTAAWIWERLGSDRRIAVTVDAVDGLPISDRAVVSLALAAHELVTNCMERAFADGAGGRIRITLRRCQDGYAQLEISDDGRGPEGSRRGDRDPIGLILVRKLVTSFDGVFEIGPGRHRGTSARVTFPAGPAREPRHAAE